MCIRDSYDIDNTLVPHGAPADERAVTLFQRLRVLGYQIYFLSNNKEPRVQTFHDAVWEPEEKRYLYKAGKPGVKSYLKAMEDMGTNRSNTFFVGDQLLSLIHI